MRSMRFILWAVLGLGILWGGYWFVGARAVKSFTEAWFADQAAAGMVAENTGVSVAGFADRFDMTVNEVHLADPVSGWGWRAPFFQVLAMTWKPWHLIAALPNTQVVEVPDGQKVTVDSSRMMASLLMRPTAAMPPDQIVLETETLALTSDKGWTAGAAKAVLAVENDVTRANTLRLGLDVTDLTLPEYLANLPDLGPKIGMVHVDTSTTLNVPFAWEMADPKVLEVSVRQVQVTWGAMDLTATGDVKADPDGLAEGKIDLALKGWRNLPAVVVALGVVPPQNQVTVQRGLEFLAKSGTDPEVLSLPLVFKAGQMSLGPLPLGPAPRLQ